MSKTLWHTIKLEVPKEMVNITKNDKVVVKKSILKKYLKNIFYLILYDVYKFIRFKQRYLKYHW